MVTIAYKDNGITYCIPAKVENTFGRSEMPVLTASEILLKLQQMGFEAWYVQR